MICETILLMIIMFGLRIDGRRLASVAHAAHSLHDSRPRFRIPNDLHVLPTPESGASSSDEIFTQQRIAEPKRNEREKKDEMCEDNRCAGVPYRFTIHISSGAALLFHVLPASACTSNGRAKMNRNENEKKASRTMYRNIYAVCANPRHKYHVISLKC